VLAPSLARSRPPACPNTRVLVLPFPLLASLSAQSAANSSAPLMLQRQVRRVGCSAHSTAAPVASALLNARIPTPWPSQQLCMRANRCSLRSLTVSNSRCMYPRRQTAASRVTRRAKGAAAAAAAVTATNSNLLLGAVQLEPQVAFLAQLLWQGVLLPVLASWLFVTALSAVASRARQVCVKDGLAACSPACQRLLRPTASGLTVLGVACARSINIRAWPASTVITPRYLVWSVPCSVDSVRL
jgi:hypothetical protein